MTTGAKPAATPGSASRSNAWVLALLLVAGAVLVQSALMARVRFLGACPNLLLVLVVCWGLLRGVSEALPLAFAAGIGLDLLAGLPLGTSSLALMVASSLTSLGTNRVFSGNVLLPAMLTAAATLLYALVVLLTLQLRGQTVTWLQMSLRVVAPELVLNVLLTLLVYPIMRWALGTRQ
jgi:rod shape-determining protein MreD